MKHLRNIQQTWKEDPLLQKVVRNTSYLFSSSTISTGLSSIQGILAAALLGPLGYGLIGMIISFATNVNRLLSFRMNEIVVKYAGQYLELDQKEKASAVIKAAGLLEASTSIAAFIILLLLAPLASQYIIKDPAASGMVSLYGLIILANFNTETSTAVLNIGGHFRGQAIVNLIQSIVVTTLIVIFFFIKGSLLHVLLAYMIGKFIIGLGTTSLALYYMKPTFGTGWWRASLSLIEEWRDMVRFVINTNLSGTINLFIRDSEVLWVGYFLTPLYAGYYKFGLAIMNVILMPITPFIATTYPEINRVIARKNWGKLRGLLKRTTIISASWTLICGAGLIIVGPWFLNWFKDGAYLPSLPAALILLIGYGTANIFFWNRNLLLAFNRPDFPLKASFIAGLVKTVLMFVMVASLGYLAQAGLMSLYFLLSIVAIVWYGLRELKKHEANAPAGASS